MEICWGGLIEILCFVFLPMICVHVYFQDKLMISFPCLINTWELVITYNQNYMLIQFKVPHLNFDQ